MKNLTFKIVGTLILILVLFVLFVLSGGNSTTTNNEIPLDPLSEIQ